MTNDASAVGGLGGPGGPGLGGHSGFHGGFGSGLRGYISDQGCGCDPGSGARGGKAEDKEWIPVTKLGHLVLKIMPVQKQTQAGQQTRFKAFVTIGDYNGHVGLGVKCSKEVATVIGGAIILTKLSIVPVRRGYWGNKIGNPHTVPCKVIGRCGSVLVRLIPAPRGTGIVSALVPKKLLMMAGIDDCYTSVRGCTATLGNFAKATFDGTSKTYLPDPDLWKETMFTKSPYQEFTDHLLKTHTRVSVQRTQAPAVATT
uniref:Small ribosomal subunit protein uS5 n=1 Tax=Mus spicilegus TaxID=10103 RepID=A0A8C6N2V0_MUSSI